jgi:hypothetical protein
VCGQRHSAVGDEQLLQDPGLNQPDDTAKPDSLSWKRVYSIRPAFVAEHLAQAVSAPIGERSLLVGGTPRSRPSGSANTLSGK